MRGTARVTRLVAVLAVMLLGVSLAVPVGAQSAVPARPTGLEATSVVHDSVSLGWDDPEDDTITHYKVLRRDRDVDDPGLFAPVNDDTGSAETSYTDPSAEPEKRYVYRVVAVNTHGESTWSSYENVDTPAATPARPTGLEATSVVHDSVSLGWDDPEDDTITHYKVLRRDRDVDDPGLFATINDDTGSAETSYTDPSAEPEKRYVYRVVAVNTHGESTWSSYENVDTPAVQEDTKSNTVTEETGDETVAVVVDAPEGEPTAALQQSGDDQTNASLASLTISPGLLHYRSGERSHTAYVTPETASVTVAAVAAQPGATVETYPDDSDDVADGHQIATAGASTTVTVTVTSADDTATETHTITVVHRIGAVKVAVGWEHACVLLVSGQVECWGYLGYPGNRQYGAVSPPASDVYVDITAARFTSCGVRPGGVGHCFDQGRRLLHTTPPTTGLQQVSKYSVGACWMDEQGYVECDFGMPLPADYAAMRFRTMQAGFRSACALGFDSKAYCWGYDQKKLETPDDDFTFLSYGGYNACGILIGGTVKCWKYEYESVYSETDLRYWTTVTTRYQLTPPPTGTFSQVSSGYNMGCGVTTGGTARCWDTYHAIGNPTNSKYFGQVNASPPADMAFESVSVGLGLGGMCGVRPDGRIACYGHPRSAQIYHPAVAEASLRSLSLDGIDFDFDPETLTYSVNAASATTSTTVNAEAADSVATVTVLPTDTDPITDGLQVELPTGPTTVTVTVISSDGLRTQVYTITVTRT